METQTDPVEYSIKVLGRVQKNEVKRLQTGMALRSHLKKLIDDGVDVSHYRLEWLATSRSRLVSVLQVFATEFNEAHPRDKISGHDFCDLLSSTISAIVGSANSQKLLGE
jgi:hypothetical protein